MGLFEKKFCDICGQKIGLLGNHKTSDGNVCGNCAGKLSPFFHGMKNSTLQQIREQMAYRETNRQQLNVFNPTKVLGYNTKVYLDPGHNCFIVSKKSDYRAENADIINMSQVLGAISEVKEHKSEIYQKDAEGHNQSYNPKRYKYSYEIIVTINVNSPYFNKIEFEVTKDRPESKTSQEFMNYQHTADEIVAAVTGKPMQQRGGIAGGIANGIGQAVAGAAGVAGLAGLAGALLGNQNNNGMQQQGYAQQGFNNNGMQQGYAQQGFDNNGMQQGYAQQGFNNNGMQQQGYAQQGFNNNGMQQQGYAQQGFNNNGMQQGYAQQGFNNNGMQQGYTQPNYSGGTANGYAQQGFNNNGMQQGFGGQWVCQNCGTTNTGNFCQSCGSQRF